MMNSGFSMIELRTHNYLSNLNLLALCLMLLDSTEDIVRTWLCVNMMVWQSIGWA